MNDELKYLQLRALQEQVDDLLDSWGTDGETPIEAARTGPGGDAAEPDEAPRLAIVVGHTQDAPGASGVAPISQSEYPWNRDLAQRIVTEAQQRGALCRVFFRDDIGIAGAYRAVGAWRARAAIELHFNAFNRQARGTETLHGTTQRSAAWARVVHDAMVALYQRTGTLNRGLRRCPPHPRGSGSVNALPNIPTCLIEPFFGDNTADATLGQQRKGALAVALTEAFIRFAATQGPESMQRLEAAPEGGQGPETQQCSAGWRITGYYSPHEEDFGGPQVNVTVNGHAVSVRRSFRDEVKLEGWGRTREGWYLGYYNDRFHRDTHPRDARGNPLTGRIVAVDPARIPFGSVVSLPDSPAPFNAETYTAADVGSAINGKHIDVYCGEGREALHRTHAVTGNSRTACHG